MTHVVPRRRPLLRATHPVDADARRGGQLEIRWRSSRRSGVQVSGGGDEGPPRARCPQRRRPHSPKMQAPSGSRSRSCRADRTRCPRRRSPRCRSVPDGDAGGAAGFVPTPETLMICTGWFGSFDVTVISAVCGPSFEGVKVTSRLQRLLRLHRLARRDLELRIRALERQRGVELTGVLNLPLLRDLFTDHGASEVERLRCLHVRERDVERRAREDDVDRRRVAGVREPDPRRRDVHRERERQRGGSESS